MKEYKLFVLNHPDDNCGGPLINVNFCLMGDFSIVIVGDCAKCGAKEIGLKYSLTQLYKWAKTLRAEPRKPIKPPLQIAEIPLPKFTDDDNVEAHGLSIIIPPDEPEAA